MVTIKSWNRWSKYLSKLLDPGTWGCDRDIFHCSGITSLGSSGKHFHWQILVIIKGLLKQTLASIFIYCSYHIISWHRTRLKRSKHWGAMGETGKHWGATTNIGKHCGATGKLWGARLKLARYEKQWETLASASNGNGWGWGWSKVKTTGRNGELGEHWKTLALKLGQHWGNIGATLGQHYFWVSLTISRSSSVS